MLSSILNKTSCWICPKCRWQLELSDNVLMAVRHCPRCKTKIERSEVDRCTFINDTLLRHGEHEARRGGCMTIPFKCSLLFLTLVWIISNSGLSPDEPNNNSVRLCIVITLLALIPGIVGINRLRDGKRVELLRSAWISDTLSDQQAAEINRLLNGG